MKDRLAIWTHGGIGGGFYSQGQPSIQDLVVRLSKQYDVDVYSLLAPNDDFKPEAFRIFSCRRGIKWTPLRWGCLIVKFLLAHAANRYKILYAFWGYPSGVVAVSLSKVLGLKSVVHLQGGDSACVPEIQYGVFCDSVKKRLCRWTYRSASLLICLTEYQKSALAAQGISRLVEVIPFGPDLHTFRFTNGRFATETLRLIHIGNQTPVKDQRMLIDAFTWLINSHKAQLTIVGFDAMGGELERYAERMGVAHLIRFTGPISHHRIPEYLLEADVILQSSLYEGQGVAMAEAAACGALLAGTRVGLLADIGGECGVVVDVKDSGGLIKKLLSCVKDPNARDMQIRSARKWIEQHDAAWTYKTIDSKIQRLLNE